MENQETLQKIDLLSFERSEFNTSYLCDMYHFFLRFKNKELSPELLINGEINEGEISYYGESFLKEDHLNLYEELMKKINYC